VIVGTHQLERSAMKSCFCLLLMIAFQCGACEPAGVQSLRKDVEQAFMSKSFNTIADKYADAKRVQVVIQNDYNDDRPLQIHDFASIAELAAWFSKMFADHEQLFIPEQVVCRGRGCSYQLPGTTLHHGLYLQGFEARKTAQCTAFAQIRVYLG
jgi:hypothetical protein